MGKTVAVVVGDGQNKSANAHVNIIQKDRHTCTPGTEMNQEATDPGFVEISDLDDEEGSGSGPRCLKN